MHCLIAVAARILLPLTRRRPSKWHEVCNDCNVQHRSTDRKTEMIQGIQIVRYRCKKREKELEMAIFFMIVGSSAVRTVLSAKSSRMNERALTISQVLLLHLALDTVHHFTGSRTVKITTSLD